MFENVTCVIVTYADRGYYVEQTVQNARIAGVKNFVVVDNGSSIQSKIILDSLNVNLITLTSNSGAANGFKVGIEKACQMTNTDLILCLDDDNIIQHDAVVNLLDFWNRVGGVLFCLRYFDTDFLTKTDYELNLKHLEKDILNLNSYCYFSLDKLVSIINSKLVVRKNNDRKYYETVAGAFGGMFFHKNVLCDAVLPDTSYVNYFSDIKFSYELFKKNNKLYLLPNCKIADAERSLTNSEVKSYFSVGKILQNFHDQNIDKFCNGFFTRVKLEKDCLITSEWKYRLNKSLFKSIILPLVTVIYFLRYKNIKRIILLKEAIKNGEK